MNFPDTISKEELKCLPLLRYDGDIHVIDSNEKIKEATKELKKETLLGFDTEKKPTFKKGQYHPTALIQFATDEKAFLS